MTRLFGLRAPALVGLAIFLGAAAGTLGDPAAADHYRSEAVVAILLPSTSGLERHEAARRTLASAIRLPVVLSASKRAIGTPGRGAGRVSVAGDPRSSLLRVRARNL